MDKTTVTAGEIFTFTTSYTQSGTEENVYTLKMTFPSTVVYNLDDVTPLTETISEVISGDTKAVTIRFRAISAEATNSFTLPCYFEGASAGESLALVMALYVDDVLEASCTCPTVTLSLSEDFQGSFVLVEGSSSPITGEEIVLGFDLTNLQNVGDSIENAVVTVTVSSHLTPLTSFVVGEDISAEAYADSSQDGVTATWEGNQFQFVMGSYSGEQYRILIPLEVGDVPSGTALTYEFELYVDDALRGSGEGVLYTSADTSDSLFYVLAPTWAVEEEDIQYCILHSSETLETLSLYTIRFSVPDGFSPTELRAKYQEEFGTYSIYIETANKAEEEQLICTQIGKTEAISLTEFLEEGDSVTAVILQASSAVVDLAENVLWISGEALGTSGDTLEGTCSLCYENSGAVEEFGQAFSTTIGNYSRLELQASILNQKKTYYPMDEFTVALEIPSGASWVLNPVFATYLSQDYCDYVYGSAYFVYYDAYNDQSYDSRAEDFPLKYLIYQDKNYKEDGKTLLRGYFSDFTLKTNSSLGMYYDVMVTKAEEDFTYEGYLGNSGNLTFVLGEQGSDFYDLDGDGITDEILAKSSGILVQTATAESFSLSKTCKGDLDFSYSTSAYGTAGGQGTYLLEINNSTAENLTGIDVVEIFPYVGDTEILDTSVSRGSEYNIFSTGEVVAEIINPITGAVVEDVVLKVEYSTSPDPIRFDGTGTGQIGVGTWSETPPTVTAQIAAIRVTTGEETVLEPLYRLRVICGISAPIGAPVGTVSYNSFACLAYEADVLLTPQETETTTLTIGTSDLGAVGQFVWYDENGDGIYDEDEVGINGVTVELYQENGTEPVETTETADNYDGNAGYYQFNGLSAGNYFLKFLPPEGDTWTKQNLTVAEGSRPDEETGFTPLFALAEGEQNLLQNAGMVEETPESSLYQAITDVIESVALEQTALSHILNAEGEKIQKAVALDLTDAELLAVNTSVQAMVEAVTDLEEVLQKKIGIILGNG